MHNLNATELEEIMSAAINIPTITIKSQIITVLGFKPNVDDDPDKVVNSWAFTIDGDLCAIWDYKGSHLFNRWSCYDPTGALPALFDVSNIVDGGW
jgi:hypothetical protein